jgi:hypothetical protein
MIKNRIIDRLRFPQFKCTFTGLNAAALCHGPIAFLIRSINGLPPTAILSAHRHPRLHRFLPRRLEPLGDVLNVRFKSTFDF